MPLSRKRHDPYGRPLPVLVDVEPCSLRVTHANSQQQHLIERLLQAEYDALLVHGTLRGGQPHLCGQRRQYRPGCLPHATATAPHS